MKYEELTLDKLKDTLNGIFIKDPERTVKIYTGKGGMDLIQKAFEERGVPTPKMNTYMIEQDFPGEPEKLF